MCDGVWNPVWNRNAFALIRSDLVISCMADQWRHVTGIVQSKLSCSMHSGNWWWTVTAECWSQIQIHADGRTEAHSARSSLATGGRRGPVVYTAPAISSTHCEDNVFHFVCSQYCLENSWWIYDEGFVVCGDEKSKKTHIYIYIYI